MLDHPTDRAAVARRLVRESDTEEPLDERDPLARDMLGGQSNVQLRYPIRNSVELKRLLLESAMEFRSIAADLDQRIGKTSESSLLAGARFRLAVLCKRLTRTARGVPPLPPGRVRK